MDGVNCKNLTTAFQFVFTEFPVPLHLKGCLFLLLLIIYFLTFSGNSVIIFLVVSDVCLNKPMYFFLGNFSFLEIGFTSTTVPLILLIIIGYRNISIKGCFVQFYVFTALGAAETFLLTVMSFDRYLAICNPLNYSRLMDSRTCKVFVLCSWTFGSLCYAIPVILVSRLPFSGSNYIEHLFCDLEVMKLSCHLDYFTVAVCYSFAVITIMPNLLVITVSYFYIMVTIIRMPSAMGRGKAFSTCTSHLTVVILFYTSVLYMYLRSNTKDSIYSDKLICLVYSLMVPFLNPLIYSFRNKDVKHALKKCTYGQRMIWTPRLTA